MRIDKFKSLSEGWRSHILSKLAILSFMTSATKGDWLLAIPEVVLMYRTAHDIFRWATAPENIEWNKGGLCGAYWRGKS